MPSTPQRLEHIDLLRGFVIVLMALDHARDFFQPVGTNPTDLDTTTPLLFATRWITHLCAPTFVLLAGVGMGLQLARRGPEPALLRFFVVRGLWLMLLEVTWVTGSWYFGFPGIHLGVLWGIGGAMVVGAALARLPLSVVGVLGLAFTLGLSATGLPDAEPVAFFFRPESYELLGMPIWSTYVIVPWAAVLAMGMGLSSTIAKPRATRALWPWAMGALALGVGIRLAGVGDDQPWHSHNTLTVSILDFLDVRKYPPSVVFLLLTLGTSFAVLPALAALPDKLRRGLATIGRVPLFFYLLHLPFLHLLGWVHAQLRFGESTIPETEPLSLPLVYGAWLGAVALLWWPCVRYAAIKSGAETRRPWMRFI